MKVEVSHEFEVSADRFWDLFFAEDFNAAMWPALDLDRRVVEFERKGEGKAETIHRVQQITTRMELPKIVQKLVQGAVGYAAHNEFDRARSQMTVRTVPNALANKVRNEGLFIVEPLGPDRCRRTYRGEIEVQIPVVGRKVEKQIAIAVSDSLGKAAEFTRKWLRSEKSAA